MNYCKVALPLPLKEAFDYSIPEDMSPMPGCRVKVPLGKKSVLGVVVSLSKESQIKSPKPIQALLDGEPLVSASMLEFTRWMADYYLCGWGEVLPLALPPAVKGKRLKPWTISKEKASLAPQLTSAQRQAVSKIESSLKAKDAGAFLLHGVTGSGKTEVYLHALAEALALGGGAIVLVPEIALTPQTLERFESRFPGLVAVLHSGLTATQRLRSFEALQSGQARVALGARSALFAPVRNLKLIVVDEESEPSYKQESVPRYHARDASLVRARLEGAVTLLGSATPSFESYANAQSGKLKLLKLPGRVGQSGMPVFEFTDRPEKEDALSEEMVKGLRQARAAGEQSLLFLNRRGFAPVLVCVKCGESIQCPNCSISMTFHKDRPEGSLRCHLCGAVRTPPLSCPREKCGCKQMKLLGIGTQRLEEEVRRIMPGVRVIRVDRDSVGRSASADFHQDLGRKVHAGELDVLLGTQMLAKGLDFPNLTFVGVVNADASLAFPDFRAEERTYQLLVQVAGRAGRADKPGRVVVQTRQKDHPCLQAAARQDFEAFFKQRIKEREELGYPPFGRMAALILRSEVKAKALAAATDLGELLTREAGKLGPRQLQILGPAPAPLIQVKSWWRYRLLVKASNSRILHQLLEPVAFGYRPAGALLAVDVDPLSFL